MSEELHISSMLDFSEIDLTAPNKVVEKMLAKLPEETKGMILGRVDEYDGPVVSYDRTSLAATVLKEMQSAKHFDIQNELGKKGEQEEKYECYLCTPNSKNYKYRLFFMKYGLAKYPVQFTLDESIASYIEWLSPNYVVDCNNRKEVEDLIRDIFHSRKIVTVMQELIRIYQSKAHEEVQELDTSESKD